MKTLPSTATEVHCATCGRPKSLWNRGDVLFSTQSRECPGCVRDLIRLDTAAARAEDNL